MDGIFIESPNTGVDSNEDSRDDADMLMVNNLTDCQLQAGAEIKLWNNEHRGSKNYKDNDKQF